MRILFIHQNFPGQFRYLAPALANKGHEVTALSMVRNSPARWQGVRIVRYAVGRGSTKGIHPWAADIETKTIRGEACFRACLDLKAAGYTPDVIVAHPGWGESLFVSEVWPSARIGIYCEFYYRRFGADSGFDPEFPAADPDADACRLSMKNINSMLHFEFASAGLSPTFWQADFFPEPFRSKISVIHDGIDTGTVCPDPAASLTVCGNRLHADDEVITFVNRNLEPYRGYHVFMRALPELLERRPNARIVIVGGDGVSYGAKPKEERSWKQIFIDEVRPRFSDEEWSRVLFPGKIPYPDFVSLLQVSSVHVYLTYPFVLSWSLLEAMSAGCAIVASDTTPVREVITHGETGLLVDFFDTAGLANTVCNLLDNPEQRCHFGTVAREYVRDRYDLRTYCLPGQVQWVENLATV